MTLSLNTERIEEMARKIAARTGLTPEDAVAQALAEKLSRVEAEVPRKRKKASAEEIMAMANRISDRLSPEWHANAWKYVDDLYDEETGLPN